MSYQHLLVGHDGAVVVVKMARGTAKNALNASLIAELRDVLAKIAADSAARAMLLTGDGDTFCAGADLKERHDNPGKDAEFRAPLRKFWHALALLDKPLVIAVNGQAAGGGFELALLGDAVIAADSAQFWLPEVQWGGIPGGWGTQLLPRLVGPVRARWIILNGHHISAREMLLMGLVTHVVPQADVLDVARGIAQDLAARPPAAVAMAKQALRAALETPLASGIEIEEKCLQQAVNAPERTILLERFAQGHRSR